MSCPLSIVLVTYNSADELPACLAGVEAQRADLPELELVVVDNASADDSVGIVAAQAPWARTLPQQENPGFATAVNVGVQACRGEVVLLLNPDCVMHAGCAATLVAHLAATPGTGVAAANLVDDAGHPLRFALREPTLEVALLTFTSIGRALDARALGGRGQRLRWYDPELFKGASTTRVDCPAAACVAIRRRDLEPRAMDPRLPLYFNDADLYRRLRKAGRAAEVVAAATAMHEHAASTRKLPAARNRAEMTASVLRYAAMEWRLPSVAILHIGLWADALLDWCRWRLRPRSAHRYQSAQGSLGGLGHRWGAAPWLSVPPTLGEIYRP